MYRYLLREDTEENLSRCDELMKDVMEGYRVTPILDESGNIKDFEFERIHRHIEGRV